MKVPFIDLRVQYDSIRDEIAAALQEVLDNTAFVRGPAVVKFEKEYAAYCQCKEAVACNSGTSALWLALLGLGIGEGDEVITSPNTFIATVEAISFCGAKPVFVDIDEATHTLDAGKLEEVISPRTRAIIPVHLYGQMADMDPITEIARAHGLFVVEDASQAHGAEYKGRLAGTIGDAGCFSFYPGKNLGAYGEAGGVVTNDSALAGKMRMLQDHGQRQKYYHEIKGWNARMDGFQGAVLTVKLPYLPAWNEARRKNARLYDELLAEVDEVMTPAEAPGRKHVYYVYVVRTPRRDALMSALAERDIACNIHFPIPVHLQEAYRDLGHLKGSFPVSEACANEVISLPMYAELTAEQIHRVVDEIKSFFGR